MGFFDFFKQPNINEGVEQYRETPNALLIDVRTPQEYKSGRIPGSKNIPLQNLEKIKKLAKSPDTPLFVYCQSGGRSSQASSALKRMGYSKVTNIGGIGAYTGKVAR
ncbi:MAG: rhodanese-like domain-containing protein [Eggerthellaceae bacterium]|nr:rhodanese-like domain-containing protein [Eggerthellaceae bacterium]